MKLTLILTLSALTIYISTGCTSLNKAPWKKGLSTTDHERSDGKFYPPNPEDTYKDEKGIIHCKTHREPLTEVHGFWTGTPVPMITPTDEYFEHAETYPNRIRLASSLYYSTVTPERHWFRYCKECERGLKQALSEN